MGEGKTNLPMGHQKQSEEAAVHRYVAMNVEESGTQEAHSHVAAPNSKEEDVICHVAAIAELVEDDIIEEEEEEDHDLDNTANIVRDNVEHVGAGNTVTAAAASHAAETGGEGVNHLDGLLFDDDDYVDYIAMVQQEAERDEARLVPMQARTQAPVMARLAAPANDPFNSTMQALFASAKSGAIFVGMEEGDDNDWYESIARDAQMMEQMEDLGLDGMPSSPLQLPKSQAELGDHLPCAKEFSPESGPSTKRVSVAPLADDEVAKFDCGICLEALPIFHLFHGMPCPHKFCVQCMGMYIEGKVHAGEVPIPCPDPACKEEGDRRVLHPEDCKKSINFTAFCSWNEKLVENAILPHQRVYCPNRKCKIMLEKTCVDKTPSEAPCPACNRLMCTTCGLDWSTDGSGQHDCAEGPEALAVKRLATERRWKQCPRCRILVERTMGCDAMTCRCRAVFCYTCGRPMLPVLDEEEERCRCRNLNDLADLVMQE